MIQTIAPALKCLLDQLIDYAGLYPPAQLSLEAALANYESYRAGEHAWMLRYFVVGAAELDRVPRSLGGYLSVLAQADEPRSACIETNSIVKVQRSSYCEIATDNLDQLNAVKEAGAFAKIRCGGVKPEAIPACENVAAFIRACAQRRLPFKATAGLHHPIRAQQALTYENAAPRAVMHGFVNVLMAAAFAWHGEKEIEPIIADGDAQSFRFDERAHWRDKSLSLPELKDARANFMHAIGSCSFEEPISDLKSLGWL